MFVSPSLTEFASPLAAYAAKNLAFRIIGHVVSWAVSSHGHVVSWGMLSHWACRLMGHVVSQGIMSPGVSISV